MAKITLEAARVNCGMTQQEMADAMGVSRSTVIEWENGKRKMRPIYLFKYCQIVGFKEDDILLPEVIT